ASVSLTFPLVPRSLSVAHPSGSFFSPHSPSRTRSHSHSHPRFPVLAFLSLVSSLRSYLHSLTFSLSSSSSYSHLCLCTLASSHSLSRSSLRSLGRLFLHSFSRSPPCHCWSLSSHQIWLGIYVLAAIARRYC